MKEYLKWIFQFWKGEKLHILLLIFFTIISSLVSLSLPFIFKFIIDNIEDVLKNSNEVMDFNKFIYFLVILAFAQFVAGLYPGARAWLNSKIGLKIRNKVFKSILKKDYKFFNKFTPGDLSTRLTDDIIEYPRIAWFSCSAIFRALESLSRLIFCLIVMFIMSWQLTLLALIPLPIMLYIFYIIKNRLEKIVERNRKYTSNINNLLDSTFVGISVIKSYSAEKGQSERLEKLLNKKIITDYDITKLVTIIHSSYSILGQIGKVVIMFVGGLFVIWNKIGMGDFFAFYIYLDMILMPMMDIPNLFVTSRQAFISIDREKEILNYPNKKENKGRDKVNSIDKVEFKDVSFSYNNNPVVRNLNFIVNKGESYAIVGEVGSGKSTVLGLLSGLLQIGNGKILINNQLYENIERSSFLKQIGYVSQDTVLFSGSISENIKIGREFNSKKIGSVLKAVNLNQEIIEGKDKILTQSGGGLSGGQKQRVAIARALISSPSLLLLDDSTSALDAETESFFWESLQNKIKNIIIIVVSHRLSTIKQCDKIIFIHRGKIVSIDNHNNLLKNKLYKEVLATEIKKN